MAAITDITSVEAVAAFAGEMMGQAVPTQAHGETLALTAFLERAACWGPPIRRAASLRTGKPRR
jgi:hypothetical protein